MINADLHAFHHWMNLVAGDIEQTIADNLPAAPAPLTDAMRYSVLGGGKRLRTMLCLAASVLTNGNRKDALLASSAIEMIHAYSLIHDDLPCMDDDDLRRGKPSCHKQYGEAMALLAGDALLTQAFIVLSTRSMTVSDTVRLRMLGELSQAAGAEGMVGGQCLDLEGTGKTLSRTQLETMHSGKTGAIIRASILLGAWTGSKNNVGLDDDLIAFSRDLGLLYQLTDDILDVEGATETLGKTAGKDQTQDKSTYVKLLGLAGAKKEAQTLAQSAIARLNPYGDTAVWLQALTQYIAGRTS